MGELANMADMATLMTAHPLRDRRGRPPRTFSATAAKNAFGQILDTVLGDGMVVITKRDAPKAVVLSFDEYQSLAGAGSGALRALSAEFDQLLAGLQTARARKGLRAAFDASPRTLGQAAVKAAARRRG